MFFTIEKVKIVDLKKDWCYLWEECSNRQNVPNWFARFHRGDMTLENGARSEKSAIVDKIKAMVKANLH